MGGAWLEQATSCCKRGAVCCRVLRSVFRGASSSGFATLHPRTRPLPPAAVHRFQGASWHGHVWPLSGAPRRRRRHTKGEEVVYGVRDPASERLQGERIDGLLAFFDKLHPDRRPPDQEDFVAEGRGYRKQLIGVVHGDLDSQEVDNRALKRWMREGQRAQQGLRIQGVKELRAKGEL